MSDEQKESQSKEQFRVVIDNKANEALCRMVAKINDGFSAGAISKSDLANYIFSEFEELLNDSRIKEIRKLYFDEKKALEALMRKASGGDGLPQDLRAALLNHCGFQETKRASKRSQEEKVLEAK